MLKFRHHRFRYGTQALCCNLRRRRGPPPLTLLSLSPGQGQRRRIEPHPWKKKRSKQDGQYLMSDAISCLVLPTSLTTSDRSNAAFASDDLPVDNQLRTEAEASDVEDLDPINNSILHEAFAFGSHKF
ncbi:hypothetical protein Ddye_006647 [Dipteronia dyeriana]|uniref:Uncharacterized protein n=1 Tax=Dipteronia dyeriana TaxID=168575 RepID=A0AAE0CQW5_9ROSI|nr:hypothetical protein Ddye_006647 [Dipteronia dyeriana]